jgi:tripartite-type tricarboxylate transporter receptor subunit TctC
VAKAAPDGYTLLVSNANSLASGLVVHPKVPHDLLTGFAPVSILTDATIVLVLHASVPAQSVSELVALARRRSGGLNAALAGMGTIDHLLTAMFRQRTGIEIEVVPYKGGRAVVDLISGQADMSFIALHAVREFIKAGRLRAIAVSGLRRAELLPDVPTMAEAGHPEVVGSPWNAMLAPAGTPREIVTRVNAHVARIMRTDEMKHYLREKGSNALGSTPEEAHAFIREEIDRWAKVVKEAGVKAE